MSDSTQAADHTLLFGATIRDALDQFAKEGHTGNFRATREGRVECLSCHATHDPKDVHMPALCRIEGVSDPADEELVAAITCPACAHKGTLILTYGPGAPATDAQVLQGLQDTRSGAT